MIRIGVIGAGPNGTGNAKKFAAHADRAKIVAVADIDPPAGQKLADVYDARVVTDFREMLDDVDAVVVSTPNDCHCEQTLACAAAGKHLWIEKPMALSVADADRMVEAVESAGVASMVGFGVRFGGIVRRMKETHRSGQIGELVSLWTRRLCFFDPQTVKPWRLEYERSGGVMSELITHEIDWMIDLAGDPKAVYCRLASRRHQAPGDNDHLWMTMDFGGEVTGTIEGSQMALIADYHRGVVGREGSVATRGWGNELFLQTAPGESVQLEPMAEFDRHGHFLDVIDQKCESLADVRHGRKVVRISQEAVASAVRGEVVAL